MFKKENGVTLVALVITIIVLLILAGVSIALVSGDNGVLEKAQKSSTKTKYSQITEGIGLALVDCQSEYADEFAEGNATHGTMYKYFTEKAIVEALDNQGYKLLKDTGTAKAGTDPIEYEFSGNFTVVTEDAADDTSKIEGLPAHYRVSPKSTNDWVAVRFIPGSMGYTATFGSTLSDDTSFDY